MMLPFGRKAKLQKLLKELQIDIVSEALKFSVEIQTKGRELAARDVSQTILNMDALIFLVYALGKYLERYSERLMTTVFDATVIDISRLFGKMIGSIRPELAAQSEAEWLYSLDMRSREFSNASSFSGQSTRDKNSVCWLMASAISSNVGEANNTLFELVIETNLMKAIGNLNIGQRVEVMNELL
jgi:hypothetical protein